jgi:hypothetical protein
MTEHIPPVRPGVARGRAIRNMMYTIAFAVLMFAVWWISGGVNPLEG